MKGYRTYQRTLDGIFFESMVLWYLFKFSILLLNNDFILKFWFQCFFFEILTKKNYLNFKNIHMFFITNIFHKIFASQHMFWSQKPPKRNIELTSIKYTPPILVPSIPKNLHVNPLAQLWVTQNMKTHHWGARIALPHENQLTMIPSQ